MEYLVLGPLAIVRDGVAVPIGSAKQRALLALLLIHANEVVSTDRIMDALWGDERVPDRQNALWVLVSNVRSALEPERQKRSQGAMLLTRTPGYLLRVGAAELDVWGFERLVQEGRTLIDRDPAAASLAIGQGLALWRGRPYDDVTYESFAQPEIARLDELRMEAVELRIDADLRQGQAAELVGELEGLVRQHPFRERLVAELMMALYRSGRHAEALRAFQRLRARLGEEMGLEPSEELCGLERRMIIGDPSLDRHPPRHVPPIRLAVRGYELRDRLGDSELGVDYRAFQPASGRELMIRVLAPEIADDPAFIRRFEADGEQVARLEHPQLVKLCDYWREPHAAFLVTAVPPLHTLVDVVRNGPLDPAQATQLLFDVGSALSVAHLHGVVHGNVGPDSIRVEAGRSYLTDFPVGAPPTARTGGEMRPFVSPEQLAGQPATTASDVFSLGRVWEYALTGDGVGDEPAATLTSPALEVEIRRATSRDPRDRHPDASTLLRAVRTVVGAERPITAGGSLVNPYKGLRAFEEADADDFFGRERVVERLVNRLGDTGSRGRFIVVVGPSGSGKSSVVNAGLLPAVRRGVVAGSDRWFVVSITPGSHPFEALEAALLRIAVNPPPTLLEQLVDGEAGMRRAVHRVLPGDGSQLLLVLDQFEELFTHCPPVEAHAFQTALAAAVDDQHSQLRVVATLRADFYDRPLRHRTLGELVRRGTEVITPVSPAEIERAIDGPAERSGVRFEPGLVAEMVADVADHEGSLPLLQYALTELFDRRCGSVIELDTYRELGGVSGALARRADSLYAGLDDSEKVVARQILLRLVDVGEGTATVRRRVLWEELTVLGDPGVNRVLDTFGRHRLLVIDRDPVTRAPTVEVAHEALLTEWGRLRAWTDECRDDLRQRSRLRAASADWEAGGRDPELLMGGTRLEQFSEWAATTDLALDAHERAYLEQSVTRRDEQAAAEHIRHAAEERLRRKTRARNRLLVAGAAILAVVAGLAIFAFTQRSHANQLAHQQNATGIARRLAAEATVTASTKPELAMLLALQSLETSARAGAPTLSESEEALQWAIQGARVPYPIRDAPALTGAGPNGLTGIFQLPLQELVDLARHHIGRALTVAECQTYDIVPCPTDGAGLASPAAAGSRSAPSEPAGPPAAPSQASLAGTHISIVGLNIDSHRGMSAELNDFYERTGIQVSTFSWQQAMQSGRLDNGIKASGFDIALLPQPAAVRAAASSRDLIDLSTYLDVAPARHALGDYLVTTNSQGPGYYGVPLYLDLKGLVWYPVRAFAESGYQVPRTFDDLVRLSRQMVVDGHTPWCMGFEDGGFSGWPGTDWIEALVLRVGGVDTYDSWTTHQIPFASRPIRQAMQEFGDIAFGTGFINGGAGAIARTARQTAVEPLVTDPPGCWLYYQGSFAATELPGGAILGRDVGFFDLPALAADAPTPPALGGAELAVAITDRPEVRAFIRGLLDPQWGATAAANKDSVFLSANRDFDPSHCRAPGADDATNTARVALCRESHDALAAGQWRFDGSDEMPDVIGQQLADGRPGAFLQGMLDYVNDGPASIDTVLSAIDAAWPPP